MNTPLVSICSITYNHAPFIRQCLDGFLMQQCNFPIEIIINDDCSTDGTTEIIREYAEKYPDKIFPIFHEENLYSQGVRGMFQKFVYPKARGKYIALCEGDDYWTDPLKLQKQVDFLESHPDYSMCFHAAKVIAEQGRSVDFDFSSVENRDYTGEELLNDWLIPTASMVFKTEIYSKIPVHKNFRSGDVLLYATCSVEGKIRGMKSIMSVYRLHSGGWTAQEYTPSRLYGEVKHFSAMVDLYPENITLTLKTKIANWCVVILSKGSLILKIKALIRALFICPEHFCHVVNKYSKNRFIKTITGIIIQGRM